MEILHQQQGLTIKRNEKNKFVVCTLFYFADPDKRTPEWEAEARMGMTEAQWAKEYLIDYTALYGEKVFPEIVSRREDIVVKAPYPEIGPLVPCFGGFDYGARNPASFHVYAIMDGITYAVWELYEPCVNVAEFAQKMRDCPYWGQIKYVAADPSIWYSNQQMKDGNVTSIYNWFLQNGVSCFIKGLTDEAAWLATMRGHWGGDVTFKIFDSCRGMVEEFEGAVFQATNKNIINRAISDNIADYNNHAMDDCKYFMNSKPDVGLQHRDIKWPIMINRWKK